MAFFVRTKLYSVYLKRGESRPLESAVFIKQGFNIWAFLLTPIWALVNRLWLLFLVLAVISGLLTMKEEPHFALISLLFSIWFGFEANNFKAHSLERKNYILFDVVTGIDKLAAEQRFYDKYLLSNKLQQPAKSGTFTSGFVKPEASL